MQSKTDLRKLIAIAAVAAFGASATSSVWAEPPASSTPETPATSPTPAPGMSSGPSGEYEKLDADKDGTISKREARKNKNLAKKWSSFDANKDGKLDQAEFAQFEAQPASSEPEESPKPAPAPRAAPPVM